MDYLLSLSDGAQQHMVVLTLTENAVRKNAVDVVLDVIGCEDLELLVENGVVAPGQVEDLKALQQIIFDKDQQGIFIRESVFLTANARDLNPDAPFMQAFVPAERDGVKYFRCDVTVIQTSAAGAPPPSQASTASPADQQQAIKEFQSMFFLHEIAIGRDIDVTKEFPELDEVLKKAEREELVEVDVKTATYRTTEKGKRQHDVIISEAQDLIRRYDIFGDVDVDQSGVARFDTGLGRDLRVPVYEIEGVDPFRARFLLGLNDGEWDKLDNWTDVVEDPKFYAQMMEPVERAPSAEEIGRNKLMSIIDQGKAVLRQEPQSRY